MLVNILLADLPHSVLKEELVYLDGGSFLELNDVVVVRLICSNHLLVLHQVRLYWKKVQVLEEKFVVHELREYRHDVTRAIEVNPRHKVEDKINTPIVVFLDGQVERSIESHILFDYFTVLFLLLNHKLVIN